VPEYIRPSPDSTMVAVTPAALEIHNTVRWGKPDIKIGIQFASGLKRTLCRSLAGLGAERIPSMCQSPSAEHQGSEGEP
jgi:hypothetical protein